MRERRGRDRVESGRQLLDAAVGELRQIVHRLRQRGEGRPAGLVRDRDGDVGASGERLQERPFRSGQVLEAVGEHRLAAPRVELTRHSLRRVAPQQIAVPETEAIELTAVGGIEGGELPVEIVRIEQSRLELRDGR